MKKIIFFLLLTVSWVSAYAQTYDLYVEYEYVGQAPPYFGDVLVQVDGMPAFSRFFTYPLGSPGEVFEQGLLHSATTNPADKNWLGRLRFNGFQGTDNGVVSLGSNSFFNIESDDGGANWQARISFLARELTINAPVDQCYKDDIELVATAGHLGNPYAWTYSIGGATPIPLPASFQGRSTINLSLEDIFGALAPNFIETPITFQVSNDYGEFLNPVIYTWLGCGLNLIETNTEPTTCARNNDGEVEFVFDEDLNTGSTLRIYLYETILPNPLPAPNSSDLLEETPLSGFGPQSITDGNSVLIGSNGRYTWEYTDLAGDLVPGKRYFAVHQVINPDGTVSSADITDYFTIRRPTDITVQATETNTATCIGENATYTLLASGGDNLDTCGTYSYSYRIGNGAFQSTSTSLAVPATNSAQTITVRATYCANGCTSDITDTSSTFTIPAAAPSIVINDVQSSGVPPSGPGLDDGSIQIELSQGTGRFDFELFLFDDNSGNFLPITINENTVVTNYTFGGLPDGRYRVEVRPTGQTICSDTSEEFNFATNSLPIISNVVPSPPSCSGQLDGSITLDVIGGVAPYQYRWYDSAGNQISGETTTTLENLTPGNYSFRAISSGGNFDTPGAYTSEDIIVVPDATEIAILDITPVSPTCFDGTDGSLSITASGATDYDYSLDGGLDWSPLVGNVISNLNRGFYEVLLRNRDVPICLSTPSAEEEIINPNPIATDPTSTPASTNGGFDGSISLVITGGTPFTSPTNPYSISWEKEKENVTTNFIDADPSTPYIINGLEAATYIATITDANGCTTNPSPVEIIVNQPGPLSIESLTGTDTCNGSNTGTITANVQGTGDITFEFLLQPGPGETVVYSITTSDRTVTALDLAAGIYGLRITEVTSNTTITTPVADYFTISELAPITAIVTPTDLSCNEFNTGVITVTGAAGGSNTGFEYDIGDGFGFQSSNTFINLPPNTYVVTVRDDLGCEFSTTVDIIQAGAPIVNELTTVVNNASSATSIDGSIILEFDTDPTNYTYVWSGPGVTGITTKDLDLIGVGTYQVIVTAPGNCTLTRNFTVAVQDAFSIQSLTGTPTCFNQSNGSLTATIIATGLVTFNWILDDGTVNGTLVATETTNLRTLSAAGLAARNYYLEIVDTNSQSVQSGLFEIIELPEVSATVTPVPTCLGSDTGSITFSNPIGSPSDTYSYSIDDGLTFQANPIFEDLAAGNYTPRVSAMENPNCDFIAPGVTVTTSPGIFWDEPNTQITRASGNGASDGAIAPAFIGGTLPYTYLWSNNATNPTITGLFAGTYSVTVTDAASCSTTQNFEVTEVGPLTISTIIPTDVVCKDEANGSISTTVTGEGTITYLWTLANGDPVPVSNGVTGPNITGILAGNYILTATDDNTNVSTTAIVIGEPATAVTITNITPTDVTCFGGNNGALEIQADGGTGPYTYSLNGGTFQTSPIFNDLLATSYTVRIQDANSCEFIEPTPVLILEPQELNLIINEQIPVTAANETNGAIFITAEGGSDNYTFEWSGPNGFTSTEEDISNLAAGNYIVTITDATDAGCILISQQIAITEPGVMIANLNQTVLLECSGDDFAEITANVQGGVAPFSYQWYQVNNGNNTPLDENTNIIGNLSSGNYFLSVTDANSTTIDTNPISITAPTQLNITIDGTTNVNCPGQLTGAINITVSGGTPPYQYFWSNSATVADISGLDAGEYTIDVEDAAGCITQNRATITAPDDAIQIADATVENVSVYQALDGSISLAISGGLTPYTYVWTRLSDNSNAGNQATISNLAADLYSVSISDANGCTVTDTYEVTQPDIVEDIIVQPSCSADSDGSITVSVNQGNGTFTYLWNNGATENNINNLAAGTYTVTVTGFENGPLTRTYLLEKPIPLEVNLGVDRVLCADQTLELDATVDDETANYSWSSGNGFASSEPNVEITQSGNYTVTVQSQTGCTAQGTIFVDISTDEINAEFAVSSQIFVGENAVAVDISYPLPEGVEWIVPIGAKVVNQNKDAVELSFAEAGEYEITIITSRGDCIAQKTKKILVVAKDGLITEEDSKNGQKLVEEFIAYPNPTNGKFTTDINMTERGDVSVKVFSFTNNAMMASKKDRGKLSYSIPFDLSGLPAGVYAVLLETPYGNTLRKVILK